MSCSCGKKLIHHYEKSYKQTEKEITQKYLDKAKEKKEKEKK